MQKIDTNVRIKWRTVKQLLGDGFPLYISNALSAIIFLPLLADIATISGLQSVGYLRVGQIIAQVFTLIPGHWLQFYSLNQEHQSIKKNKGSPSIHFF